jgi:hypothetical protein
MNRKRQAANNNNFNHIYPVTDGNGYTYFLVLKDASFLNVLLILIELYMLGAGRPQSVPWNSGKTTY